MDDLGCKDRPRCGPARGVVIAGSPSDNGVNPGGKPASGARRGVGGEGVGDMVDVDEVVVDDSVELSLFSSEDFRQVLVPFGSIFGARFPPFLLPCQTSTSSPVSLSLVTTLPCSVGDESLERDPMEVDPVEDLKSSGLGRETGGKVLIP